MSFFFFYVNHPLWLEFSFDSGVILLNHNPFLRMLLWRINENKSLWKCLEQFLTPNEFPRNFTFLPLEHYCQETKQTDKILVNYQDLHSCPKQCSSNFFWTEIWPEDICKKTSIKQWYCYIYKWWAKVYALGTGHHSRHFGRTMDAQNWLWAEFVRGEAGKPMKD